MNENENKNNDGPALELELELEGAPTRAARDAADVIGDVVRVMKVSHGPKGLLRHGPYAAIITGVEADSDGDVLAYNAFVLLVGTSQHERLVKDPKDGEWTLA